MSARNGVAVTGLGVQSALGAGLAAFTAGLRAGVPAVTFEPPADDLPPTLGVAARLGPSPAGPPPGTDPATAARLAPLLRRATRSKRYALLAAVEAWSQAGLPAAPDTDTGHAAAGAPAPETRGLDATRAGVVVAGGNQAHQLYQEMGGKFRASPAFVRPSYALDLWDTDLLGTASELFGALGDGLTTGGASAAGNVGLVTGLRLVRDGYLDVCLVIAPMTELSPVERMAFFNLGALGAKLVQEPAAERSRPFDAEHDGFVYGEGAAALLLESPRHAAARGATPLARLLGGAVLLHGSRLSTPSLPDEVRVMRAALADAGLDAGQLDQVNAHATATPLGDEVEAEALREVLGPHVARPWVNATKSLTGHCLGASAAIEAVACVQQLRHGFVHPNANLRQPVPAAKPLRLAGRRAVEAETRYALSNAFGFGGINTSVVLAAPAAP
ncbi:beta-ketoacyl synthase N-terminal-like domain-containing protein [Streptomyces sp. DSM 44915]|uniref:Beta-ketoacyl synthase N-terminal-like domain-containing protein n=1 Tax=Streptomyces chisholmiae TaxID=3075540 RepID=A0ABU2JXA3_9ACTN|nr:beta-ketoacyl synthase N-terminal-like domain-containing protein [Streptomyces sp. DSM 44915]MDT0269594.1 beta-ketoacyl synthase N-terminal-like domain-containing protein [Streptomyces sp. DSM 44915]UZD11001.1 beta-ketoacyl-ACP synthase [Marinispora sp. CNQ-140]